MQVDSSPAELLGKLSMHVYLYLIKLVKKKKQRYTFYSSKLFAHTHVLISRPKPRDTLSFAIEPNYKKREKEKTV